MSNLDVAYGNHDRYSTRFFGTRFTDRTRVTAFGSINNTNDMGFGGPRGFRGGDTGLTAKKTAGMDFSWENDKKIVRLVTCNWVDLCFIAIATMML